MFDIASPRPEARSRSRAAQRINPKGLKGLRLPHYHTAHKDFTYSSLVFLKEL